MATIRNIIWLATLATSTLATSPKAFVANFDDVPAGLGTALGGTPVPEPYRNLCYDGGVLANKTLAVTGVQAASKPNIFGSTLNTRLANGGVVSISAAPAGCAGTKAQSFDISSFAFGCQAATGQSAVEVPISCTLQVKGFEKGNSGTPAVSRSVHYKPNNLLLAKETNVKLEGFKGLERVTFGFGNVVQQAAIVTVMYDFVGVARF